MNEDRHLEDRLKRFLVTVDRSGVWASIEARAGGKKQASMPKRRSALRVAVYASIAVVLVAAITVGSLEAVQHLGKDQPIVVITDDTAGMSPGSAGAQGRQWEPVPLISEGGNINTLVMDPTDPTVLYAGTDEGLFKSTDGAEGWKRLEGLERSVRLVAVDPTSPSTVYAGGGYGSPDSSFLYRSDDGGASWTELTATPTLSDYPFSFRFDPTTDPATLYLLCADGRVYRSADRGETWVRLAEGEQEPGTLVDSHEGGTVFGPGPVTVTDADTGTVLETGGGALEDYGRRVMYAGTSDGVYKSIDRGTTWKKASAGLTTSAASRVIADPDSESILYAVTSAGILKTTDGGQHWNVSLRAPGPTEEKSLLMAPSSPSTLYAMTSTGLLRTDDGGQTWTQKAGEGLPQPLPSETGDVVDGLVLVSPGDPNTVFALVLSGGEEGSQSPMTRYLWRSTDGGDAWNQVFGGDRPLKEGGDLLFSVVADPGNPSVMYALRDSPQTESRLLKSTDAGTTWRVISPELWVGSGYLWPNAITVDTGTPSNIYMVVTTNVPLGGSSDNWGGTSYKNAILRSSDGGSTWQEVGAPAQIISGLWLDPHSPDTLYVVESGPISGEASVNGLYRSTDRGATWQNIGGDLAQRAAYNVGSLTLVTGPGGALYALTGAGLYRWMPGGE